MAQRFARTSGASQQEGTIILHLQKLPYTYFPAELPTLSPRLCLLCTALYRNLSEGQLAGVGQLPARHGYTSGAKPSQT